MAVFFLRDELDGAGTKAGAEEAVKEVGAPPRCRWPRTQSRVSLPVRFWI